MNVNDENVKYVIDGLDLGGLSGREAMRYVGRETIMEILAVRGAGKLLAEKLGMANSGVLSVATADMGWREANTRNNDGMSTAKRSRNVKISGSLPFKTALAVARVLNIDPEETDIGWDEFTLALESHGEEWIAHLMSRLGGPETEGGKDLSMWIESNRAADAIRAEAVRLAAEKAARAADPLFQAKERIKRLDKMLDEKELEIAELKARIAKLESPRSGNGLPLDVEMLRIIRQRFHPDRNNGNPDLCEKVMKWVNGLAVDAGL